MARDILIDKITEINLIYFLIMFSSITNNLGRFSLKLSSTTLFKPFLLLQVRHDSSLDKFYRPRKPKHYPPPKPRDKTARYDGFLKVF